MTVPLDISWVYPIPPYAVFQMATRLEHLEEKATFLGHQAHSVKELRERGGVFRSTTERQIESRIPWIGRLLKFMPRNTITQTQLWDNPEWDGARRYATHVDVAAVPVQINGHGSLTPVDIGYTRYDIHLDVTASGWLIPRTLERVVAETTQETLDGEHEFRLLWLGRTLNI